MMDILTIKMQKNDAGADTIGDYLKALLMQIWRDGECFSGKRPFGNSGWEYEIYIALGRAGVVDCEFDDEFGDLISIDEKKANKIIFEAIKGAF